jgi:PHD/YefM family antitoxin component YafN of YafNO toxin-antitoxin module
MKTISLAEFEQNPALHCYKARDGQTLCITESATGLSVILIDEAEWRSLAGTENDEWKKT